MNFGEKEVYGYYPGSVGDYYAPDKLQSKPNTDLSKPYPTAKNYEFSPYSEVYAYPAISPEAFCPPSKGAEFHRREIVERYHGVGDLNNFWKARSGDWN